MASLDNQAQVGGKSTSVGSACGFLVRVRWWHVVRELSRSLEHLALVVRAIGVLNLLGHGLYFVYGV